MEQYSVIVRTTGKAGSKYQKLLNSIQGLVPKPQEVIVVLPEGYDLPKERLGTEHFYFCEKGMVTQRLHGIAQCKTKFALVTDDDIAFNSEFVQKLYEPVKEGKYAISAGPLVEFFPQRGKQSIISAFLGTAVPTVFHRNRYNTVLRTTGYSYRRDISIKEHKLYETQSGPWTCFFINVEEFRKIHFEDELWLDNHGYSAHDDTSMFYKGWLTKHKAVIVSDAEYEHLDAKTSKQGISERFVEARAFNTIVFWHRFIYKQQNWMIGRVWSKLCISYTILVQCLLLETKVLIGKSEKKELAATKNGIKEALFWITTKEYDNLPPVVR